MRIGEGGVTEYCIRIGIGIDIFGFEPKEDCQAALSTLMAEETDSAVPYFWWDICPIQELVHTASWIVRRDKLRVNREFSGDPDIVFWICMRIMACQTSDGGISPEDPSIGSSLLIILEIDRSQPMVTLHTIKAGARNER
jgi:hypothetical protein